MEVVKGRKKYPPRVTVYGTEGIGKSTFAAGAPAPIFLQTEEGLDEIGADRTPLLGSYAEFVAWLGKVCQDEHGYKTLVVDTLDWLEKLIWADVCAKNQVTSIEKIGYGKGYVYAVEQWREVLSGFDYARKERGMTVVLLAHSKIEKFNDPESQPYDRYTLRLHRDADAFVREWSDAVLFASRKQRVEVQDLGFNKTRAIAKPIGADGGERVLRTVGSPVCTAKNRYGIAGEIPLSWDAFAACLD